MKKFILLTLGIVMINTAFTQSTVINLNKAGKNTFVIGKKSKRDVALQFNAKISSVTLKSDNTKRSGSFVRLETDGLMKTFDVGKPDIPVYSRLIEVPLGADVRFKVLSYDEQIIDLSKSDIKKMIIPAQASVSKSEEPGELVIDKRAYSINEYLNRDIVRFEDAGILRSTRLGRVIVNPIQYNPVENKLRVLNNLTIDIEFVNSDMARTEAMKRKYSSQLFNSVINSYIANPEEMSKENITETITYVIVADRMFETALAPFITHKQQKGYNVIVGYTDMPSVGNTTTSIKNYLKGLYNNPPNGYKPPHYALLVGDIAQVPSYTKGAHKSDLYYFDYTNDNIPDLYYGRFSAQNVSQLTPQIDKTLEYEKYTMPDPTYIKRALLVAGDDYYHELTWGNGQLNYAKNNYFTSQNGITATTYLQNEPYGANYAASIKTDINNGVGFANYSAHCSYDGWSDPNFSRSDINGLTNNHKYGLWVGNCCRSSKFDVSECFGEKVLRVANKGAVGYIGASDYSYWDEDFWWAVGFKSITSTPTYNANHLGAFDRLFHTHGEAQSNWYSTQGQMIVGGNLAVEESTSSRKKYYWEIYHLMGDPSVNIRFVPGNNKSRIADSRTEDNGNSPIARTDKRSDKKELDTKSIYEPRIFVYPNPADDVFYVEVEFNSFRFESLYIYDQTGRILHRDFVADDILMVPDLNYSGMVIVKVNFNNGVTKVKKIMLK
jgi:hypothetical protein